LKKTLTQLSLKVTDVIEKICKQIYVRTDLFNRGREIQTKEFTDDILANYKSLSSPDDDLFEAANENNEL